MKAIWEELAELLEGKTVQKIAAPGGGEGGIATFVMTDGTRFSLHATDLGSWIEKVKHHHYTYGRGDIVSRLSKLLKGQTILNVGPPMASEAIALITLVDGTKFRIHATELGSWVEMSEGPRGIYRNLHDLFRDYHNHVYPSNCSTDYPASVVFVDDMLLVEAPDGKLFQGRVNDFPAAQQKLVRHPESPTWLGEIASLGDMWTMGFSFDSCPRELRGG